MENKISDESFQDGYDTALIKVKNVIKEYKLYIFNDNFILPFTAVCELEKKIDALNEISK